LVVYPIAFLHSAFACDLASRISGRRWLGRAGRRLGVAGIAAAVVAAVPGLIDYLYTIPPRSSGKSRATKHMLINSGALALFGVAQWLRRENRDHPSAAVLGAEAAGTGMLITGAWLGSSLIYRNFIGPDHRYPEAGRFQEERVPFWPGEAVPVAHEDELETNQMKLLHVNGKRIVLGRTEDGYVAFDDHCTHRGGSLADGVMICGTVQCLWHGSQFDAATGEVRAGPARDPIQTYQVDVVGGEVRLTVPMEGEAGLEAREVREAGAAPAIQAEGAARAAQRGAPAADVVGGRPQEARRTGTAAEHQEGRPRRQRREEGHDKGEARL
jgi:nitrite reductase/ring-hydroxylating ferredoxin subunit/uncharacterized membrane protein